MSNADLIKEWNKFLIDVWFKNKGVPLYMIAAQFNLLHENQGILDLIEQPRFYRDFLGNSVFTHFAFYYPRISNFLLDTKNGDVERIEKIIQVFNKTKLTEPRENDRWLGKVRDEAHRSERKAAAETKTRNLIADQRLKNGGHDWKTVK